MRTTAQWRLTQQLIGSGIRCRSDGVWRGRGMAKVGSKCEKGFGLDEKLREGIRTRAVHVGAAPG
jgi:hypothetical protein